MDGCKADLHENLSEEIETTFPVNYFLSGKQRCDGTFFFFFTPSGANAVEFSLPFANYNNEGLLP
jgi:hypothetical protein